MKYITITYSILLMLFIVSGCSYINKADTSDSEATGSTIDTEKQDVLDAETLYSSKEPEEPITNEVSKQKTYDDLWNMIQEELVLEGNINRKKVREKIAWFARNQQYIDRVVKRAEPYLYHIVTKLKERNMPLDLALLPIVESAYQPFAYSPSRASGIWQFIPSTGKRY